MIKEAVYLTKCPKLYVECASIYRRLPQNAGLARDHVDLREDIVIIYLFL
jgi:hypothetical protein